MEKNSVSRRTQMHPSKKINPWKWGFLILIALMLGTSLYVMQRVSHAPDSVKLTQVTTRHKTAFSVNLTKKQANRVVAHYLKSYLKNSSLKYQLYFKGESAFLKGQLKFLGYPMTYTLDFKPYVLENGDIQLRLGKLLLGDLPIPAKQVFNFMGSSYDLPDFVHLDSQHARITLLLSKLPAQKGLKFKATAFNLKQNQMSFLAYFAK